VNEVKLLFVVGDDFEELLWRLGVLDEKCDEGFVDGWLLGFFADGWLLGFLVTEQKG
jgi:hypothetical protein